MTINPDGPPEVCWTLQSRRPMDLGWGDDDDYYRLPEAQADHTEKAARNPQTRYRIVEATTTYRVLPDEPA